MQNAGQPTLILLHGAALNAASWLPMWRHLDPRYRVLAPDFPGHGTRSGEPFSFGGCVDTALACVAEAQGAPVILVGDSLGGYVAQAAAPRVAKEQLKGVVACGSTAVLAGFNDLPYRAAVVVLGASLRLMGQERLLRSTRSRFARGGCHEDDFDAMVAAGVHLKLFRPAVAEIRAFNALDKLSRVAAPLLFVNGSDDFGMVLGEPRFLRAAPHARAHRFQNCAHLVSMLRSAELASLVNTFAEREFNA